MWRRKSHRIMYNLLLPIITLCICACINLTVFGSNINVENFDDFVEEERRKEIADIQDNAGGQADEEFMQSAKRKNIIGIIAVVFFTSTWVAFMHSINKKHFKPYDVSSLRLKNDFDNNAIEKFISGLTPFLASAIVNVAEFTKYDLIATFFDLERRNIIYFDDETREGSCSARLNDNKNEVENYEDFLLNWFFIKIGDDNTFGFKDLRKYLELDSRAAEFDIDYDIWIDELAEFVRDNNIIDPVCEKWKKYCAMVGVLYSALGLLLLYFSNSSLSVLLFFLAFLSYMITKDKKRRTQEAEINYEMLQIYKDYMQASLSGDENISDERLKQFFVYSIPLDCTEIVFKAYNKYEAIYEEAQNELDRAIRLADYVVNVQINKNNA